ncbi:MAG: PIG-L deacetylase family protein [Thermoflexales bacterium]
MRVLVVVAHPDDPEFFAGGTIARWCEEGHEVRYVILTSGDKGSDDPDMTTERLVRMRQAEQCAAAALLGVQSVQFLALTDGELINDSLARRLVVRELRHHRPDVVLTTDPLTLHYGATRINHSDHRVAGVLVCDAIFPAAGNRMYFPSLLAEGLQPHYPQEVYFAGSTQPNLLVDVTSYVERKIAAILQHASQIRDPEELALRVRQGMLRLLADGSVRYFESFRRVAL